MANEYEHIEYKQSLGEVNDATVSLAAFATARGGSVRFGVKPNGDVIGCSLGANTLENLANDIKKNTQPSLYPSITVEGPEASAVVTVSVEESPVKPVWAFNIPHKRVGRTNQKISADETKRLMDISAGKTWDALPNREAQIKDIDSEAARRFLQAAKQSLETEPLTLMETMGLLAGRNLSNGAVLLFAENPQRLVPQSLVKCAVFKGSTSVDFLDQLTAEGNLMTQVDAIMGFIARNIRQEIVITGKSSARQTLPEYPDVAVREAVVNAICHRDYAASGNVQIRIYADRFEIWNPGMLHPDLSVADLYKEHPSRPRNPKIAAALFRVNIIEAFGTGTLRIIEACQNAGLPVPEFISEMGVFKVVFRKSLLSFIDGETERQIAPTIARVGAEKFMRFVTRLQQAEKLSTREIAYLLDVSVPTARLILRELEAAGFIGQQRSSLTDPTAGWILSTTSKNVTGSGGD